MTKQPITPVGILSKKLRALSATAESISELDTDFKQQLFEATRLAVGLEPYTQACTSPESDALNYLATRTAQEDWTKKFADSATDLPLEQEMLSGHVEGQFLQMLIRLSGAKRVLEIGMFTGYAALAMAEALPHDGRITSLEFDAYTARFARECFDRSKHGEKIEVHVGPAAETLQQLAKTDQAFDFVFIDADKTGYLGYLESLLKRQPDGRCLLSDNALICVDNTLMQGNAYMDNDSVNAVAIREFNSAVANNSTLKQVLVPLRDGVTLIQRTAVLDDSE